jgi:hypothetical protein
MKFLETVSKFRQVSLEITTPKSMELVVKRFGYAPSAYKIVVSVCEGCKDPHLYFDDFATYLSRNNDSTVGPLLYLASSHIHLTPMLVVGRDRAFSFPILRSTMQVLTRKGSL